MRCWAVLVLAISACGRLGFDATNPGTGDARADAPGDGVRDAADCGGTWCAEATGVTDDLSAVWGASSADVWAVGGGTTILRRTAGAWSGFGPHPVQGNLRALAGTAANDVWTFGDGGSIGHWDGTAWTAMSSGTSHLEGAVAFAPSDAWVVGWGPVYAARWNGSAWISAIVPVGITELHAVWGAAPDDIWAGGKSGELMHYNGVKWVAATSNTSHTLLAMHGRAANDIWASTTLGVTLHYDGSTWSEIDTASGTDLDGIFEVSPTEVWACGASGELVRWNGSTWTEVDAGTQRFLSSVGGTPSDVFVVGGVGTILRRP